jgi:hypothetical protein
MLQSQRAMVDRTIFVESLNYQKYPQPIPALYLSSKHIT